MSYKITTPFIPYFSFSHFIAFLNRALLFVTIFTRLPYLHIISSNSHCPIDLAFSSFRALAFIYDDNLYFPYTIYLQPFEGRFICIVSVYKT